MITPQTNTTFRPTSAVPKKKYNYKNVNIHEGINRAKSYSALVDSHLAISQYENHTLKSACRTYNTEIRKNTQSRTKTALSGFRNPEEEYIRPYSYSLLTKKRKKEEITSQRQYFTGLKEVLEKKTQKVEEYSELLKEKLKRKQDIVKKIAELKHKILIEKKKIPKIQLACDKIKNEEQEVLKATEKKKNITYTLKVESQEIQKQCVQLAEETEQIREKAQSIKQVSKKHKKQIQRLTKNIKKTRREIMDDQKEVSMKKQMQIVSYKSMANAFMTVNQLKQQKALLLNEVQNSYAKNI